MNIIRAHISALLYTCSTMLYVIGSIIGGIILSTLIGYDIVHMLPSVDFKTLFFPGFKYTFLGFCFIVGLIVVANVLIEIHQEIGIIKFTLVAILLLSGTEVIGYVVSFVGVHTSHVLLTRYYQYFALGLAADLSILMLFPAIIFCKQIYTSFTKCKKRYTDRLKYINGKY